MRNVSKCLIVFTSVFLIFGCESQDGGGAIDETAEGGLGGQSCGVSEGDDGTYTMTCPDGTSVTWSDGTQGVDGEPGTSCTVADNGDGSKTITCDDGTEVTVTDGAAGEDGLPGADGEDGTDGLPGADGVDGEDGLPGADGAAGTDGLPGTDGEDGEDGLPGTDGADGFSTLVTTSEEPPGENCAEGGYKISIGVDDGTDADGFPSGLAHDGLMHFGEVDQEVYVCHGTTGEQGPQGPAGTSCTVVEDETGTKTITCADGSEVTVSDGADGDDGADGADGADGTSCSVTDNADGSKTLTCDDGTLVTWGDGEDGENGEDGEDGEDGSSCTVTDNGDGSKTITCEDGTGVTVSDGDTGAQGEPGEDGEDGTACTVTDNADGSKTLSCEDGTEVTVSDGTNGTDGADGADATPCTATDNEDGTVTIECPGSDAVVLSDGADGQDGAAGQDGSGCTVEQDDNGTVTISCDDGSSVSYAVPHCGNGITETGEECDDGNEIEGDGCSSQCDIDATPSCEALLNADPGAVSGTYTLDPDLDGPGAAFEAYCDMEFEGGGWLSVYNVVKESLTLENFKSSITANGPMSGAVTPESVSTLVATSNIPLGDYTEVVYGWAPQDSTVTQWGTYSRDGGLAGECILDGLCTTGSSNPFATMTAMPQNLERSIYRVDDPGQAGIGRGGWECLWGYDGDDNNGSHWCNWTVNDTGWVPGNNAAINDAGWRYVIYIR